MSNLVIAPIVLPALIAPFIITVFRHHLDLQRIFSTGAAAFLVVICLTLLAQAAGGQVISYELGDWPAPFGIVLVLDRLSALMISLTASILREQVSS